MIKALMEGALMSAGVDHPEYKHEITLDEAVRKSLLNDFDQAPAPV
jgi:hypothetical protein